MNSAWIPAVSEPKVTVSGEKSLDVRFDEQETKTLLQKQKRLSSQQRVNPAVTDSLLWPREGLLAHISVITTVNQLKINLNIVLRTISSSSALIVFQNSAVRKHPPISHSSELQSHIKVYDGEFLQKPLRC